MDYMDYYHLLSMFYIWLVVSTPGGSNPWTLLGDRDLPEAPWEDPQALAAVLAGSGGVVRVQFSGIFNGVSKWDFNGGFHSHGGTPIAGWYYNP